MEIYNDELRRQVRATAEAQATSMRALPEMLDRLYSDESVTTQERDDAILGGFNRRRFLQFGGLTVMSAAVLAACGSSKKSDGTGATTTAAAGGKADANDVLILKTASSLEALAVAVYQKAIDNAAALKISSGVASVATLFQSQHKDHLNVFVKATKDAGATPFETANPAVLQAIQPMIDALKDETGVLKLAYTLEVAAAETYQSTVGVFKNPAFNQVVASVGGVEARHVAIIGSVLDKTFAMSITGGLGAGSGFQKTDQAVKAGTGVS